MKYHNGVSYIEAWKVDDLLDEFAMSAGNVLPLNELGGLPTRNLKEAKQFFEEALQVDSQNPYALMNLGVIYEKEMLPQQALVMYRAVVSTGSEVVADKSSSPEATGRPIVELAQEHIERILQNNKSQQSN